jgi:tRNA(fMet)-specific endonuclease VapC
VAILIDTSILVEYERGRLDVPAHAAARATEEVFLSVIGASELLHGAHRATDPGIGARRCAFVEAILARFSVLEIDLETARAHAMLWSNMAHKGQMIGIHDSWLAATCIAHGLTLVTANLREFHRVPGLRVENWLSR